MGEPSWNHSADKPRLWIVKRLGSAAHRASGLLGSPPGPTWKQGNRHQDLTETAFCGRKGTALSKNYNTCSRRACVRQSNVHQPLPDRTTWPRGNRATTCCTNARSGCASANARMYLRFRATTRSCPENRVANRQRVGRSRGIPT